jgi:hypothetical protein
LNWSEKLGIRNYDYLTIARSAGFVDRKIIISGWFPTGGSHPLLL